MKRIAAFFTAGTMIGILAVAAAFAQEPPAKPAEPQVIPEKLAESIKRLQDENAALKDQLAKQKQSSPAPAGARTDFPRGVVQKQPAPAPAGPVKKGPPKLSSPAPAGARTDFPRGATSSPRWKLQAATPFKPAGVTPSQFAIVPPRLSYWLNNKYGICVTSEECFAKLVWSIQCGLAEVFVSDAEAERWARAHGVLNGADLSEVMDWMTKTGLIVNGIEYRDGPKLGVDYSNESILQAAIAAGPVKVAIDADALPAGAGNVQGWWATGGDPGEFSNTDHCTGFCGFGPASYLYQKLGKPMPAGLDPNKIMYLQFTWSTLGVVDHAWIMSTVVEAWIRQPTTVGQTPPNPPTAIAVPNVVGSTIAAANQTLATAGLVGSAPGAQPGDTVTSEAPIAGTQVAPGSTVTLSVAVVPPPDPTGRVVIDMPAGMPAGRYTVISDADRAKLQANNLENARILGGGVGPEPLGRVPLLAPQRWVRDARVASQIGKAMEKQGGNATAEYKTIAENEDPTAHPMLMRALWRKMRADPAGEKILANWLKVQAVEGADLPASFLTDLLDWLVKNGPQILALIEMIMKLFAFNDAMLADLPQPVFVSASPAGNLDASPAWSMAC